MGINMKDRDEYFMQHACNLAQTASREGEVPIAALVVLEDKIIGQGFNQPISTSDPTGHAEILALRAAGKAINNYRLNDATLYVTLEPCVMCAGAIVHARLKRLIFGAYDPKSGAICHAFELLNHPAMNHKVAWKGGVLEQPCRDLLKMFFEHKR